MDEELLVPALIGILLLRSHSNPLENLKPKVFWKDKPMILSQAKKWDYTKLKKVKKIILNTEIGMKTKMNNYNSVVLKNLLIKIFSIANSTY